MARLLLAATVLLALAARTPVAAAVAAAAVAANAQAPPVNVTLFGEVLCPYCAEFTTDVVWPLMHQGFGALIAFRYVAWGNAVKTEDGIKCQHGPAECRLNRAINCALHLNPGQQHWLPFVVCLEESKGKDMERAVTACAEETGLDVYALHECTEGEQGDELESAAADETDALNPPHQYVPWVVVNGIPLGDGFNQLWRYVCTAYTGERPAACFAPPKAAVDAIGAAAALRLPAGAGAGSAAKGVCLAAADTADGAARTA